MKGKPKKNIYRTIHITLSKRSGYSPVMNRYRKGMTLSSIAMKNKTKSSSIKTLPKIMAKTNMFKFFKKNSNSPKKIRTVNRSNGEFKSPQTRLR